MTADILKQLAASLTTLAIALQGSVAGLPNNPNMAAAGQVLGATTGTTYYVANVGNDNCDGKSQTIGSSGSCAWRTIAKVNSSFFQPGDNILFKRGGVWRETLTPGQSGTAGNPITFSAYGSGAKPIFRGDTALTSWTTESGESTVTSSPGTGTDDAYLWGGNINTGANFVDLGYGTAVPMTGGWRFTNVAVPSGAAVTAASIVLSEVFGSQTNNVKVTIKGEAATSPATFSTAGDFGARLANPTSATVNWTVPLVAGGQTYTTPNISSIITEIIGLTGWASGHNLVIFMPDNTSTADAYRQAASYDYLSGTQKAVLSITTSGVSIYYASSASRPSQVWFNGSRLVEVSAKLSLATGKWWWDAGNSRVYVFDNPTTATVTGSVRNGVSIVHNYITVRDIETSYGNSGVVGISAVGLTGIQVLGMLSQYNGNHGILLGNNISETVTPATGFLISQNIVQYNGGHGIEIVGKTQNSTISSNIVTGNGIIGTADFGFHGISVWGTSASTGADGITITRNTVSSQQGAAGSASFEGTCIQSDDQAANVSITYNTISQCQGPGIAVNIGLGGQLIAYNVINTTGTSGVSNFSSGISINASPNVSIYNNTIYNPGTRGIQVAGSESTGLLVKNNIITGSGTAEIWTYSGTTAGLTSNYNDIYHAAGGNYMTWLNTQESWATWKTITSGDANSISLNPLFTNAAAGDFTLRGGSPAINAGVNLGTTYQLALDPSSSWPSSVVTANQNSFGSGWEMGAYVYKESTGGVTPITGDFNRDGLVNSIDLSLMTSAWNTNNTTYDLNHDGLVNSLDYVIMVNNWSL